MLLTPDGRISRYFYGVEFPGRDVRLGLVDASQGKIGTPIDKMLLFCFQYDPIDGDVTARRFWELFAWADADDCAALSCW